MSLGMIENHWRIGLIFDLYSYGHTPNIYVMVITKFVIILTTFFCITCDNFNETYTP